MTEPASEPGTMRPERLRPILGIVAVAAPVLHVVADLLEAVGGFTPGQLALAYAACLAVPFYLLGLHAAQSPRGGWPSLAGAVAYGAAFVFFAGATLFALWDRVPDRATLVSELGAWYWAHVALMAVGGVLFGAAVARAGVLPRWTGYALAAGVLLTLLLAIVPLSGAARLIGSLVRNAAFVGMGGALLRTKPGPAKERVSRKDAEHAESAERR